MQHSFTLFSEAVTKNHTELLHILKDERVNWYLKRDQFLGSDPIYEPLRYPVPVIFMLQICPSPSIPYEWNLTKSVQQQQLGIQIDAIDRHTV